MEGNEEIPAGAKQYCLLPDQTIEGIKICGKCHVFELQMVFKLLLFSSLTERSDKVFIESTRDTICLNGTF